MNANGIKFLSKLEIGEVVMTEKSFRFYLAHSSLLFYEDILKQISSHRQTFQVLKLKQTATVVAEPTIGAILQIAVNDVKANIL